MDKGEDVDAALLKMAETLFRPLAEQGAKAAFRPGGSSAGEALTKALSDKLATVIAEADPAAIAERMTRRRRYVSLKRQMNFEEVAALALDLARGTPVEQRRAIDEDWFMNWFQSAEAVSDEMLQELWARAFAARADARQRPVSLRALDTLRLMERQDVVNFRRATDVFGVFGVVLATSREVLDGVMAGHALDSLMDLSLVEQMEYSGTNIAIPGGFALYFNLPPDLWAPDSFRQYRLTARARELAATLPPDLAVEQPSAGAFDMEDPAVVARYINIVTSGFDPRYTVYLAAHGADGQRPPPGGRKATHQWDSRSRAWVRLQNAPGPVDPVVLQAIEAGLGL